MAASDEPLNQGNVEAKPEPQSWRAGEPVLLQNAAGPKAAPSVVDWVKTLFGSFGRGAPA